MRTFALDENYDIILEGGRIVMIGGDESIRQSLRLLLSTNTGEWRLNPEHGMRYDDIMGRRPDDPTIRAAVRDALMQEPRVREITELDASIGPDRHLSVRFTARIEGGIIEGTEVIR